MKTNTAEPIENNAMSITTNGGPMSKIRVLTIKATKVDMNAINFLNIVVDCFWVGIFNTNKPIGAPKTETKIIMVTKSARDSMD